MKGGNGATIGSGITQFANGEPKRWNYDTVRVYQLLKGGNGVREANVVTLCSKCANQIDAAENLPRMDSAHGVLLDGVAVKKCGSFQKSLS